MDKFFNAISVVIGIVGGCFTWLYGGSSILMWALITLIVIDYITGVLKAVYKKRLSSEIGRQGIVKKIMILAVVAVASIVQHIISESIPLREIVIMFFVTNESLSVLENVAETGMKVPQKLKEVLLQLREQNGDDNDADTTEPDNG